MSKEELLALLAEQQATIDKQGTALEEKETKIERLNNELQDLKRLYFGRKSERYVSDKPGDPSQLSLFVQHPHEDTEEQTAKEVVQSYQRTKTKGKPKRAKLPDNLPVVEVIIEPEEGSVEGWIKIGEAITEELDISPAQFRIIRYVRPKYARPKAEQDKDPDGVHIIVAPLPSRVIPKGIPSAGLLAYILISKFIDHLPYYRQIQIFKRIGMKISASTINGWIAKSVDLLKVLCKAHENQMMQKNYLMADETTIKVLDGRTKGKSSTGYFWVYYDPGGKQVLFKYDPGRGGKYPSQHLKRFKGSLQTDGYKVYEAFDSKGRGILLIGCMAHVRRKFEYALGNDRERAEHVLKLMQQLYAIEALARKEKYDVQQRLKLRQADAAPIMEELYQYLEEQTDQVLPKSKIGQAINYALNRWKYVKRYLQDGKLEIDNNLVENAIRPVAIGRKNYLFCGSEQGAQWAALIYSLLASASNCGHNPLEYLKDVLQRLPDQPITHLDELLPTNWIPLQEGMARG